MSNRPKRIRRSRQYPDVATYLKQSGDSQSNLAKHCGVSQAHISRIVSGERVPRPVILERIARYANVPRDSFVRVHLARRRRAERVAS